MEIATTDNGTRLPGGETKEQVDLALRTLVLAGNSPKKASEALRAEGLAISPDQLKYWRDHGFRARYWELRAELGHEVGEEIAARSLDRTLEADEKEAELIASMTEALQDADLKAIASALQALAKVKDVNIRNSQLLRDRPTEIRETRDVAELVRVLKADGVIEAEVLAADAREIPAKVGNAEPTPSKLSDEERAERKRRRERQRAREKRYEARQREVREREAVGAGLPSPNSAP